MLHMVVLDHDAVIDGSNEFVLLILHCIKWCDSHLARPPWSRMPVRLSNWAVPGSRTSELYQQSIWWDRTASIRYSVLFSQNSLCLIIHPICPSKQNSQVVRRSEQSPQNYRVEIQNSTTRVWLILPDESLNRIDLSLFFLPRIWRVGALSPSLDQSFHVLIYLFAMEDAAE